MFKKMRRNEKQLSEVEAIKILQSCEDGVLATMGENGYPYAVPLNYVYYNEEIYFHCATTGHKLENIAFNEKVSFCVYADSTIIPEEFTTKFTSVVVFGTAKESLGEEKINGLKAIIERLAGDHIPAGMEYIAKLDKATRVYKIAIDHITGKGSQG